VPVEPSAAPVAPARVGRKGGKAGLLLAGLGVLLIVAVLAGRNEIAARLPTTIPFYQLLGLPLQLPLGMEFRELSSVQRVDAGQPVLVVTGEIANVSGQSRDVPPIRVALLDSDRRELDFGLFDPPRPALGPGDQARFEVQLGAPPPEASDFTVSFGTAP
jgi:Protein of unknown function (DUF3426)